MIFQYNVDKLINIITLFSQKLTIFECDIIII